VAEINALRDRPRGTNVKLGPLAPLPGDLPGFDGIRQAALASRPELVEAQLLIDAAATRVDLSKKDSRPDFTVGLNYTLVGTREDLAGRLNPPEDNGDDILGLSGGINLPIWRSRLAAGVEEAIQLRLAAEKTQRAITAEIDGDLADLARRIPLIAEQVALFDDILTAQAEESLRSAEAAYASGTAGALDLLDAERVLLGVRIASERARTDLAVATARLEGVAAAPLRTLNTNGSAS
jgi:outer membrane protein TolC